MTGTALKVTGTGTDQRLALADDTLTGPPANAAVRVHHDRSGFHKDIQKPFIGSLSVNGTAGRNDKKTYQRMYLSSI